MEGLIYRIFLGKIIKTFKNKNKQYARSKTYQKYYVCS